MKLHEIYSSDSNEDCREKSSTKNQLKLDVVKDNCKKNYTDDQWVDAFVHQLKSWGFEEVKYGTERGSFRHEVSRQTASTQEVSFNIIFLTIESSRFCETPPNCSVG